MTHTVVGKYLVASWVPGESLPTWKLKSYRTVAVLYSCERKIKLFITLRVCCLWPTDIQPLRLFKLHCRSCAQVLEDNVA